MPISSIITDGFGSYGSISDVILDGFSSTGVTPFPLSIVISESLSTSFALVPSNSLTPSNTLTPTNGMILASVMESTEYSIVLTQTGGS